jgi:asparagine synthase (glutamine-hydrolysing)
MTNFLVVVDPDPVRRSACLAEAGKVLNATSRSEIDAFAAVWSQAPVSVARADAGIMVIWGDALDDDGRIDAVRARGTTGPWDGFHAWVSFDVRGDVVAGADLLGFFPIYYWFADEILLIGTSIDAVRSHTAFRAELDPRGVAGILLTGGLVGGATVWRGVKRLAAGHLLRWNAASGAREVEQYAMPTDETLGNPSFDEQVVWMDAALDTAAARHVPPDIDIGMLLSGGRDSRVVAGVLHRRGVSMRALTMGQPGDYDAACAQAVAEALDVPHTLAPDPITGIEELVRHHIRVEHLANGLANFYTWGMLGPLGQLGGRVFSGYSIELLIGGTARALPGAAQDGDEFQRVVATATAFGIAPDVLRHLLRREVFGDAVDESIEQMRSELASANGDAHRRAWQFRIAHRSRYHAGSTPWRMSHAAWPGLLALDRSLIALCASLPMSTLVHRRAEDELLRTRFPALARLPLDRNSHLTRPLSPTLARRVRESVSRFTRRADAQDERRRYYRLYDINSAMWRTVRRMAEPHRHAVRDLVDVSALDALLPPPDAPIALRDPITESNGLKSLLGFLIWWATHG